MTVRVNMEADSSRAESAIARLASRFRQVENEANKAAIASNKIGAKRATGVDANTAQLQKLNDTFAATNKQVAATFNTLSTGVKRSIAALTAAAALTGLTKAINSSADSATLLENQLALVVGRTEELAVVQQKLYAISLKTGTAVSASAQLFNRFGLTLKASGKSSSVLLPEAFNVRPKRLNN